MQVMEEQSKIVTSFATLKRDSASIFFIDLALVLELLIFEIELRNIFKDPENLTI